MSVPITIQLPQSLYEQVVQASDERGVSLERVVIDTLRLALIQSNHSGNNVDLDETPPKPLAEMTPQERLNWELRAIARPLTNAQDASLAFPFPSMESAPLLSHEELLAAYPPLEPPLSQSLIAYRDEERF